MHAGDNAPQAPHLHFVGLSGWLSAAGPPFWSFAYGSIGDSTKGRRGSSPARRRIGQGIARDSLLVLPLIMMRGGGKAEGRRSLFHCTEHI